MFKVFFDTSVLFSAIYSKSGGSAKLVSLVKEKYLVGITTQTIIEELDRNTGKINNLGKEELYNFIVENNFLVRKAISIDELKPYKDLVEEKDIHVLAGAISTGCDYLVTLDKKHLDSPKVRNKIKKIKILSPKELLYIVSEYK